MKAMPENPNRGSSFEDFLEEEGILDASNATEASCEARSPLEILNTRRCHATRLASAEWETETPLGWPVDPEV